MKQILVLACAGLLLGACAGLPGADNPYPGSGGLYMGTPSKTDIESGRAVFNAVKFASFKPGVTTKKQVAAALGRPSNWRTLADGSSEMGYDYVDSRPSFFRQVKEARFVFDPALVLKEMRLPDFGR